MSTTRTHLRTSVAVALIAAATLVAAASATAAPARMASTPYPWPVKPFDKPHPVRGSFGDPRTLFHGPPTQRTLLAGSGSFTFHTGVDVSAPDGTAVYPVESGTVAAVQPQWLAVSSGGRVFEYWHVTASVRPGDHVTAQETVLGHIIRGCGHVHLTEIDGGVTVNPLAEGHLTPYEDHTTPTVGRISFRTSVTGEDLMPELLRGRIEFLASAQDMPTMQVPGAWGGLPVTPALLTWQIRRAATGKVVVRDRTAYDVRTQLPSQLAFWQVYARGSHQNMSVFGKHYSYMQPGVYLFRLAPGGFDTRTLPDSVYDLVVTATDIRGNTSTEIQRFSIHNKPGVVGT
jgi:hypothetical protein